MSDGFIGPRFPAEGEPGFIGPVAWEAPRQDYAWWRRLFRRGFTWIGTKYMGPFNAMDRGLPTSPADWSALYHDRQYARDRAAGLDPYTSFVDADQRMLDQLEAAYDFSGSLVPSRGTGTQTPDTGVRVARMAWIMKGALARSGYLTDNSTPARQARGEMNTGTGPDMSGTKRPAGQLLQEGEQLMGGKSQWAAWQDLRYGGRYTYGNRNPLYKMFEHSATAFDAQVKSNLNRRFTAGNVIKQSLREMRALRMKFNNDDEPDTPKARAYYTELKNALDAARGRLADARRYLGDVSQFGYKAGLVQRQRLYDIKYGWQPGRGRTPYKRKKYGLGDDVHSHTGGDYEYTGYDYSGGMDDDANVEFDSEVAGPDEYVQDAMPPPFPYARGGGRRLLSTPPPNGGGGAPLAPTKARPPRGGVGGTRAQRRLAFDEFAGSDPFAPTSLTLTARNPPTGGAGTMQYASSRSYAGAKRRKGGNTAAALSLVQGSMRKTTAPANHLWVDTGVGDTAGYFPLDRFNDTVSFCPLSIDVVRSGASVGATDPDKVKGTNYNGVALQAQGRLGTTDGDKIKLHNIEFVGHVKGGEDSTARFPPRMRFIVVWYTAPKAVQGAGILPPFSEVAITEHNHAVDAFIRPGSQTSSKFSVLYDRTVNVSHTDPTGHTGQLGQTIKFVLPIEKQIKLVLPAQSAGAKAGHLDVSSDEGRISSGFPIVYIAADGGRDVNAAAQGILVRLNTRLTYSSF